MKDRTSTDGRAHSSFSLSERVQYRVAMEYKSQRVLQRCCGLKKKQHQRVPPPFMHALEKKFLFFALLHFSKTSLCVTESF